MPVIQITISAKPVAAPTLRQVAAAQPEARAAMARLQNFAQFSHLPADQQRQHWRQAAQLIRDARNLRSVIAHPKGDEAA